MKWFSHPACLKRTACVDCRTDRAFRQTIVDHGQVDSVDFACPVGLTAESAAPPTPGEFRMVYRVKGCGTCAPKVVVSKA